MTRAPQDHLSGSLDMLVLQSLSLEERHGFDVAQWVHERTRRVLRTPDGALYKSLHRLEERGLVAARWGRSATGRKAKYYRLTTRGDAALRDEKEAWATFSKAITRALKAES